MSTPLNPDRSPRFYGRRRGKPLRAHREHLMQTLLPKLRVPIPDTPDSLDGRTLFEVPPQTLWLEIGFGGGEHLAAQANANRDIGIIGAEPFVNGVARLMSWVEDEGLENVRVYDEDVRRLLPGLKTASIDRLFILFSDPWPKARHHNRRLVSPQTLDDLARILVDGAEFRFAHDDMSYIRWALFHIRRHPAFEWTARTPDDWRARPKDAAETRYEAKALSQGKTCVYLSFRRKPRGE